MTSFRLVCALPSFYTAQNQKFQIHLLTDKNFMKLESFYLLQNRIKRVYIWLKK